MKFEKICYAFICQLNLTLPSIFSSADDGPWDNPPKPVKSFDVQWNDKKIELTKFIKLQVNGKEVFNNRHQFWPYDLDDNWHGFSYATFKGITFLKVTASDGVDLYVERYFVLAKNDKKKVPEAYELGDHNDHTMFVYSKVPFDFTGSCFASKPCESYQKLFRLDAGSGIFKEVPLPTHTNKHCLSKSLKEVCESKGLVWKHVKPTPLDKPAKF